VRILIASSEVHPYSKTGGLADMTGALAKSLARAGHSVGVVSPLYARIREKVPGLTKTAIPLDVPLGDRRCAGEVWTLEPAQGLTFYFIEQAEFFDRPGLYQSDGADYPDNAARFVFFSKAIALLALHLPWKPQLLHLNDWQAALAALFVRHQQKLPGWGTLPRICMTIHNLAYQGVFHPSLYSLTNLPWDYFVPSGVEFYGQMNCLKAGITFADVITTVSPRYAREITTPEFGCGLDGLLRFRKADLVGILNGADYEEWSTISNPYLAAPYSVDDLSGKLINKLELQREFGFEANPRIPLFGNIGRMVEQKGVDLLLGALHEMGAAEFQFVMVGNGAHRFQRAFRDLARLHPSSISVHIGFDERLSHRIEAGSDFFVMPSRFEPCGLNQMYSLRYGTIPVVRATGGLDDTVVDVRESAKRANGIKFHDCSSRALAKAMGKALVLHRTPELLQHFRQNAMRADFSWDRTAQDYVRVYERAIGST
jgi:starch synthase